MPPTSSRLPRGTVRVPDTQRENSIDPKKVTASSDDAGAGVTSVASVIPTEMGLSGVSRTRSPGDIACRECTLRARQSSGRTVLGCDLAQALAKVDVCSFARAKRVAPACRTQVEQRHEHVQKRGHARPARVGLVDSGDLRSGIRQCVC